MSEHHHMEAVPASSDTPVTFRRKVYRLMFEAHDSPPLMALIDKFIVTLIILSVCAIGLEHIDTIHEKFRHELETFDKFSVYFFTLEYIVRLYCIPESEAYQNFKLKRLRYAVTPMALVDFVVIVPFYLSFLIEIDLRYLRLLRLLRVLKLVRFIVPKIQEFRELNQGRTAKQKIYSILNEDDYSGDIHSIVDTSLVVLIGLSVTAVVLESVQPIHDLLAREFHLFDMFSVFVFTVEYVLRMYCITENPEYKERIAGRVRYGTTVLAMIDLLSILPFYLTFFINMDLRFLRVMRLLRILKLTRYSTAMQTLISVVRDELPV
ncbi:MAG: ion transporter, partial [Beijerinckiaceae bacterium]